MRDPPRQVQPLNVTLRAISRNVTRCVKDCNVTRAADHNGGHPGVLPGRPHRAAPRASAPRHRHTGACETVRTQRHQYMQQQQLSSGLTSVLCACVVPCARCHARGGICMRSGRLEPALFLLLLCAPSGLGPLHPRGCAGRQGPRAGVCPSVCMCRWARACPAPQRTAVAGDGPAGVDCGASSPPRTSRAHLLPMRVLLWREAASHRRAGACNPSLSGV